MAGEPEIVVLGAGAMGLLYAGLLAPHARVTVVDPWSDQIEALKRDGLTVTGYGGERRLAVGAVHLRDAATLERTADFAIALVSAGASRTAAETARTVLKPDGFLLTLQNGVGNIEAYSAALSADRVMAGLSYHSAALGRPGTVAHTHHGPTWLGEVGRPNGERLKRLTALFDRAGAEPREVADVISYVWTKFIHNCAINAVCAVAGLRVGEIPTTPGADELQTRIIEEALAVVRAKGHALADPDPLKSIKAFCRVKFNRPSMLQQIEASRETEIDALNGAVVREGAALGIPTPYNQAITWMVKSLQDKRIRTARNPNIDYDEMERRAKQAAAG
jgi:2-dehydropantoate 2-reductase